MVNHPYGSTEAFTLTLYFGRTAIEPLQEIGRQLFEAFPCPILLVEFRRGDAWQIAGIKAGALHKLRDEQQHFFADALDAFNRRTWRQPASKRLARFDLAILHDPAEELPPSNAQALEQFIENGKPLGIDVELIERKITHAWPSSTRCSSAKPRGWTITPTASRRRPRAKAWW